MSRVLNNYIGAVAKKAPAVKTPPRAPKPTPQKFINPNLDAIKVSFKARGFPDEEIFVKQFDKNIHNFLHKSSMFYGLSGTGKTVLINDFMYRMRHVFPRVVVFAPTNEEKHDFDGIVPTPLIYEHFTLKDIKNLYEQQRAAASVYNNANNLKVLHQLFSKVATRNSEKNLRELIDRKNRAFADIERNISDVATKKKKREEIKDIIKEKLIELYKSVIKPHRYKFLKAGNLDQKEALAIKYLDYNPNLLVIFDDAMKEIQALIREGKKLGDNVIENFFYKGRHAKITHFYAFQEDSGIDPGIRKNAFNSFFTTKNTALHFFNTGSNNFTAYEKKKAAAIAEEVWNEENDARYCKLAYIREGKDQFQYTIADVHDDFEMCSKAVRKYCKKIMKDETEIDTSNPHMNAFMSGI